MNLNTHTDAKTESLSSTQKVLHANTGISVRMLPEQWIEIEVGLPGAELEATAVRMRGKVLTIEATRPKTVGRGESAGPGIDRVTTRVVLRDRPRGPIAVWRQTSGGVAIRLPLAQTSVHDDELRAIDGIGGIAAELLAHARSISMNHTRSSQQDSDVFPRRSGDVSVS
jgi:hypothetical protein|tara:strand:- start:1115 stop:1621 length:507 start_codon:yes stop_codon:yes gene_type:complete